MTHLLTFITDFIAQYGYYALILGIFIEGEVVLVTAGLLAHQHHLSLTLVILTAFFTTILRDQSSFTIGRIIGTSGLHKFPTLKQKTQNILNKINKYKNYLAFIYQFTLGFRYLAPFGFGVSSMKRSYFFCFNILNALIWSIMFSYLGYYLGSSFIPLIKSIKNIEGTLACSFLLIISICGAYKLIKIIKKRNIPL